MGRAWKQDLFYPFTAFISAIQDYFSSKVINFAGVIWNFGLDCEYSNASSQKLLSKGMGLINAQSTRNSLTNFGTMFICQILIFWLFKSWCSAEFAFCISRFYIICGVFDNILNQHFNPGRKEHKFLYSHQYLLLYRNMTYLLLPLPLTNQREACVSEQTAEHQEYCLSKFQAADNCHSLSVLNGGPLKWVWHWGWKYVTILPNLCLQLKYISKKKKKMMER